MHHNKEQPLLTFFKKLITFLKKETNKACLMERSLQTITDDSVYVAKLFVLVGKEGGQNADQREGLFTKLERRS